MTASIYLLGAPGVGKSTLMELLLAPWAVGDATAPVDYRPLVYEPLNVPGGERAGVYLGKHRDDFSGTDALSMSALPAAVRWAAESPLPDLVYGEGARLAHPRFLSALAVRGPLLVLHLVAPPTVLGIRRANRGSDQNAAWARGQETRSRNTAEACADLGLNVRRLWATPSPAALAERARVHAAEAGFLLP